MIPGICFQTIERPREVSARRVACRLATGLILLQLASAFPPATAQPQTGRSVARSYFTSAQKALAAGDSTAAIET